MLQNKNLTSTYLLYIITIIVPFIVTPIMIKKLGIEVYSLWILLNTVNAYLSLSNFGFNTTLLKKMSENIKNIKYLNYLFNTVIFVYITVLTILSMIYLFSIFFLDNIFNVVEIDISESKIIGTLMFTIFIINFFGKLFETILFSFNKLYISNNIIIFNTILIFGSTLILLLLNYSIIYILCINTIISILKNIILFIYSKKYFNFSIKIKMFSKKILYKTLTPSFYYFIMSIASLLIFYSDSIMITYLVGLASVGTYTIGYKIVDITQQFTYKIVDINLPNISLLQKQGKYTMIYSLYKRILLISISISLFFSIFLYFTGIDIIEMWVGNENTISKEIFIIFIIFGFINSGITHVSTIFISALGIHKNLAITALIEGILNILFSLFLYNLFGLMGIAFGTLIAHVLTNGWYANYLFYVYINKKDKTNV